jgi:hypothetical protein
MEIQDAGCFVFILFLILSWDIFSHKLPVTIQTLSPVNKYTSGRFADLMAGLHTHTSCSHLPKTKDQRLNT